MIYRLYVSPRGLHFSLSEDSQHIEPYLEHRRQRLRERRRGRPFRLSDHLEHLQVEEYGRGRENDYFTEQVVMKWLQWMVRKENGVFKTTEYSSASHGDAKCLGTIRVYIQKLLFHEEGSPSQKRRAKLVMQSLLGELQYALVYLEDHAEQDLWGPDDVVQFQPTRFQEIWPDQWALAETLWKEHINTLWSKLRKRLHLVRLFREAKERAIHRLYCPGSIHYQEAKERFQAIQQELTPSSSSSSLPPKKIFLWRKRRT